MLFNPVRKLACHADVQRTVAAAGQDVDAGDLARTHRELIWKATLNAAAPHATSQCPAERMLGWAPASAGVTSPSEVRVAGAGPIRRGPAIPNSRLRTNCQPSTTESNSLVRLNHERQVRQP